MSGHVQLASDPREFFRDRVSTSARRLGVSIDEHVEFYLVNLLYEFVNPDKINIAVGDVDVLETPLALMLKQAVESPLPQRIRIMKALGDTSLYFAGFFQDYFTRKTFDISYYITLGSSAYENVSTLVRDSGRDEQMTGTFVELSNNFVKLVDIVAEVSAVPGQNKPTDILAVYDRWTRSNSDRLRRILEDNGITPIEVRTRLAQ